MPADPAPVEYTFPLVREGMDEVPILFANDFVVQFNETEFILTIGQLQPPILIGTEEQRQQMIEGMTYVPIKVISRLGLTEDRMREFVELLGDQWKTYLDRKATKKEGDNA